MSPYFFQNTVRVIFHSVHDASTYTTLSKKKQNKKEKTKKYINGGDFKIVIIISDAILPIVLGTRPSILNPFFNKNPFDVYAFWQYLPLG